jgi:hypothetical protein
MSARWDTGLEMKRCKLADSRNAIMIDKPRIIPTAIR